MASKQEKVQFYHITPQMAERVRTLFKNPEDTLMRWEELDRLYWVAWVRQKLAVEEHKADVTWNAQATKSFKDMMIYGREMELLETQMRFSGWKRPPPPSVLDVFGGKI